MTIPALHPTLAGYDVALRDGMNKDSPPKVLP